MSSTDHRIRDLVPDPSGGLTIVAQAWEHTEPQPDPLTGVDADDDSLLITDTDPGWAGSSPAPDQSMPNT